MAAALANGTPAEPPPDDASDNTIATSSANKRKRQHDPDIPHDAAWSDSRLQQTQKDILQVLQRYICPCLSTPNAVLTACRHDSEPSFLKHPVASPEPANKKARLSNANNDTSTIAAKLENTSYSSLQQIKADAALVSQEMVSSIRAKAKDNNGGRPTVEELKQMRRIQMIETVVTEVVEKESRLVEEHTRKHVKLEKEDSGLTNGHVTGNGSNTKAGTVLTLFGNAPGPRQLFSSMQSGPTTVKHAAIKSELPVEEMPLPNGISATKVMPVSAQEATQAPTFEEAFPPPYNLPALNPPKSHKRPTTRETSVTWEFKDPVQRNKKGGYTVQPLTTGGWLGYGGIDGGDPNSSRERRKERTRALSSSGETAERPAKAVSEDALIKEEEALFRRAYSSFAPSYDNSNAVVSEDTKNMVWWHKVGNKRFDDTFAIDPALLDADERSAPPPPAFKDAPINDEALDQAMQELDELAEVDFTPEPAKSKTEVEQVLQEISELLETLASHQRIRNATLATSNAGARTPLSPAPSAGSKIGRPDEPSDEEQATYNSLRRELAYLILKLPPYAIAKLDGDQLADLGVSKLITYQMKDTKGAMEEDLVTRQAKMAALATASSVASLTRPNSSAGQHYNTTAQRTPAIGQAANTRYGQQYAPRTPAAQPHYQRHNNAQQSYGTPGNTASRSSYGPTQYSRSSAPLSGYGHQSSSQYYQRGPQQSASGYGAYSQQYQQTPQTQQRPNYATQQMPQYQQQQRSVSQAAAANAVAYQTNTSSTPQSQMHRTASPAKGYPAVSMAPSQRPMYPAPSTQQPGSGRVTPNNHPSQPHTPVNGFPPAHRQPQGIAPRPSSSTPQPQLQAGPPTNGTS